MTELAVVVERYLARCIVTETGCLVPPTVKRYGDIKWDGRRTTAHRAVFINAHGEVAADQVIRHKCDNPPCVRLDHLEQGTSSQNARDMHDRGRHGRSGVRGARNPSAKLTAETVVAMRRAARSGMSVRQIANQFEISYPATLNAVRGGSWAHLSEPPVPQARRWGHPSDRRLPDSMATHAQDLAADGLSLAAIALQLGINRDTAFALTHREVAS